MLLSQFQAVSIHCWWKPSQTSSSGGMKYSISICSNSRLRKMKLRGVISLRNALPTCAMPKGTFTRAVATTFCLVYYRIVYIMRDSQSINIPRSTQPHRNPRPTAPNGP